MRRRLTAIFFAFFVACTGQPMSQVTWWPMPLSYAYALPSPSIRLKRFDGEEADEDAFCLDGLLSGSLPLWKAFWLAFVCGSTLAVPVAIAFPFVLFVVGGVIWYWIGFSVLYLMFGWISGLGIYRCSRGHRLRAITVSLHAAATLVFYALYSISLLGAL